MFFLIVENKIYLFDTQDGKAVEFYDCISINSLSYCRRPAKLTDLVRNNDTVSCENNGGIVHRFNSLSSSQINLSVILHEWKSSVEKVEEYSRYLRDSHSHDGYLCQCVHSQSFGKNCEYRLPTGTTIDQTLEWQLEMKSKNKSEVQKYGDIICYDTYQCDSGLLCLDWREICDGSQQCMFGDDEKNCDILELNVCDHDEYRCMNGMCIPNGYFLDGEYDCLDWSDEMPFEEDRKCTSESVSTDCDDRICPPNQWSCGDGQCIGDRLGFQKSRDKSECLSRREQYFVCETHVRWAQLTMPNGRCHRIEVEPYEEPPVENRTTENKWQHLLKCFLSLGAGKGCQCPRGLFCLEVFVLTYPFQTIQYPRGGLIAPYVFFLYTPSGILETGRRPTWILINGTINCRGMPIRINRRIPFDFKWDIRRITEEIFCRQSTYFSQLETMDNTLQQQHPINSIDVCNESNIVMSPSRIKDGYINCFNQMDEFVSIDIAKSCRRVQHNRFRCSINQSTCLSVMTLGDQHNHCQNRFDQQWMGKGRKLSEMNCNKEHKDECSLVRQYIEQSWRSMENIEIPSQFGIPFHFYCDTFQNLDSKEDENLAECRQWWNCAQGQWQCRTGQCIDRDWLADGEWDCADASDEENFFYERIELLQRKNSTLSSTATSKFAFGICNRTHPFPCLSLDTSYKQYTCLNLSQLNNGVIDCAGAIDEQNILEHCDQSSILGYNFKCSLSNTCIPYVSHCRSHRCPNKTDDEQWCLFLQQPPLKCFLLDGFLCLDGRCVEGGRCNRKFECSFGEDEYMCDYRSLSTEVVRPFREKKAYQTKRRQHKLRLFSFPTNANITRLQLHSNNTLSPSTNISSTLSAYWCNRGIGIFLSNKLIVCFCPPQYYGEKCQYHSDRLIVVLHVNLTQSIYTDRLIVLKFLALFLFENEILMINEFHVRPALKMSMIKKKIMYFLYSRSPIFLQRRIERYHNRSNIINSRPYSVRIEMYEIKEAQEPIFKAVWQYPVNFDYLPVFRLSPVLRLNKLAFDGNLCTYYSHNRTNEECHRLINDPSKHIFLCKNNFTGLHCSVEDKLCISNYCAPRSLCKPDYRRLLQGNASPYCVCPSNQYGDRCDIEHERCQSSSCFNGGTCHLTSMPDQIECSCTDQYFGPQCQWRKSVHHLSLQTNLTYSAVVIQYFTINFASLYLILVNQQVHTALPSFIQYLPQNQIASPEIVVAKLYSFGREVSSNLYLLSLQINASSIIGATLINEHNRCVDVHELKQSN